MDIIQYLNNLKRSLTYERLLNHVWKDERVQKRIISLNTFNQLFDSGVDSDGNSLGDYSPVSVQKYGKPEGHIRLYDTGAFYESFKIIVKGVVAEITANTQKEDIDLADEYGEAIIGLTNESKESLTVTIKEVVKEYLRKSLSVN